MRFKILGAGPGMPDPDKGLSCIYVNHGNSHFLFDCGEGCSRQVLRHGLSGDALDAVFVSHYHPDHITGVFMLVQMFYLQNRRKDLHLFLPEREAEFNGLLQLFYTFIQKHSFRLLIHSNDEIAGFFPEVKAIQTDHLLGYSELITELGLPNQMRSWAFRIGSPGHDLVYSADIQTTTCIDELLEGCHTAIIDAMHPPVDEILRLAETAIPRVLLTHGLSGDLEHWLKTHQASNFELAQEDIEYRVNE